MPLAFYYRVCYTEISKNLQKSVAGIWFSKSKDRQDDGSRRRFLDICKEKV